MLRRIYIAIAVLIFASFSVIKTGWAQNVQFKHYSTDEGFTGSGFKSIAQDSLGFLWICSNSGIYKFDGYHFTLNRLIINDSTNLRDAPTNQIWVEPNGRVWVGSPDHISLFDASQDRIIPFRISLEGSSPETTWFENENTVWLGTIKKGLVRLDHIKKAAVTYVANHTDSSRKAAINTIREIEDEGSMLLLGTAYGLWKFNKQSKTFIRPACNPADTALLHAGNVTKIFSHAEHYWLWIDQLLLKVDRDFSLMQTLDFKTINLRFDPEKKHVDTHVLAIEQDAEGIFWIASQGLGLIRYDPTHNQLLNFRNNKTNDQSLPSDILYDVMIDRDKNIWVTTVNKGIAQLKKQSLQFYNHLAGVSTTGMTFLHGQGSNRLMVGSNGKGLWMCTLDSEFPGKLDFEKIELNPTIKGFESIIELCAGKNTLWLGSLQSGVLGLPINHRTGEVGRGYTKMFQHDATNPNTISENFVTALQEDKRGHLWIGTFNGGLNDLNPDAEYGKSGAVNQYRFDLSDSSILGRVHAADLEFEGDHSTLVSTSSGLFLIRNALIHSGPKPVEFLAKSNTIFKLFRTSDGTLFAGTKSGLFEVRKTGKNHALIKAPLPGSPMITSIQEDHLGRIWCSSFEGLFVYDRNTQFVLQFKKEDGLPSSRTVNAAGSAQTPEGMMIFSNAEGITVFDPLSLRINASKPKPVLTQLKINNEIVRSSRSNGNTSEFIIQQNISMLNELTLDYTQNIIMLEFAAMDFTAPERSQYEYQLENFDKDWVLTDWKNRMATYTNLSPGDYTFKVRASNRDGVWSDHVTKLKIRVLPAPWKTWWAYSIYGVVLAGILFVARKNVIQRERLTARLNLEHLELEKVQEIDKVKTSFFANISHEFRTPLTLIQGPTQFLIERLGTDKEAKAQLKLIQQNADRLLRLVNQILELARLESGSLKNEISEGELDTFLRTVVGSFSSLAVQKKISFIQQIPSVSIQARFDKDKLEKIVSNLISNAIKFTPATGAVIVNASLGREASGIQNLLITITDTGKGVSPEQMNKVFERFYQVSEDGNLNTGTGIGLALSKELAEFLGGSLALESKIGEGCKFTLTLPIDVVTIGTRPQVQPIVNEEEYGQDLRDNSPVTEFPDKPIVLIVEDHAELRKFIVTCLGKDYHFLEAANGSEGLKLAIEQVPSLVLSDVMMPELDGIKMCAKIKQDYRTSHIPVIFLTAKASNESKLSGLEIGADDYLIKPFNKEELILKLRNHISARSRMQEKIRLETLSSTTIVTAISADEKFLERIKKIIEDHLGDEQLSVERVAEEVGLSRVQLYRKVVALTGISVNEFIRRLRLQRAAQLLRQRWGPVSQVAYEVGFTNLSYFSKCFKEEFDVLPSEYTSNSQ